MGPLRAELTRVREQTKPLVDLIPTLERILEHTETLPETLSVVERISRQTEPLAQLLAAVEGVEENLGERLDSLRTVVDSLESEDSYLNNTVGELVGHLGAMHETVDGLKGDVRRLTDRMPDASRGPLEKRASPSRATTTEGSAPRERSRRAALANDDR